MQKDPAAPTGHAFVRWGGVYYIMYGPVVSLAGHAVTTSSTPPPACIWWVPLTCCNYM
jgi:hypothetical protein